MDRMRMLELNDVIDIHDDILSFSDGLPGLSQNKSLESALYRIENHKSYSDIRSICEIAALYAIVIAQGHTFNDGNKRTALVSMYNFLELNGILLTAPQNEIAQMMVDVAEKRISHDKLTLWVETHASEIVQTISEQ